MYVGGCRCSECLAAHNTANRQRDRAKRAVRYGLAPAPKDWVDPAEARAHLDWLSGQGVGTPTIAAHTGISTSTLIAIRHGRRRRISARVNSKILATPRLVVKQWARVPAGPTWERIDDLVYFGWTKTRIAQALGWSSPALTVSKAKVSSDLAARIERIWSDECGRQATWHGDSAMADAHDCHCLRCERARATSRRYARRQAAA
jgi:hypothetical protein